MLEDMQRVTYDVFDINASLSAQVKTTMWSRLARVDGVYQMVGSSGFVLPLTMGNHAKKYGVADEHIDAKVAATFMYASQDISAEQKTRNTITTTIPTVADVERAAKKFDDALASAGMSEMLSSVTLKKWVNNDKRFPLDFPIKALFFLSPDDITERNRDKILDTAYEYLAVCPRKAFGGKSSTEQAKIVQNKSP